MLKAAKIKASIPPDLWKQIPALHIVNSLDSTNTYVMDYCTGKKMSLSGFTCLAEQQTAGRGRWGRTWVSPHASHIYLSMLWQFPGIPVLAGLSLVVGLALTHVLKQLRIEDGVRLKWPNDVYYQGKKLAGILIEKSSIHTIIGIGLNVKMPEEAGTAIHQPWTDLNAILGTAPDRNLIAGLIISELLTLLPQLAKQGLSPFLEGWQTFDIHYQKYLRIQTASGQYSGIAQGINSSGELIIQCDDGLERSFHSGEVLSPVKKIHQ